MRFVLTALLALALGLLPAATGRAEALSGDATAATPCHQMGDASDMSGDHHPASDDEDMQACAEHCLSQVNGQPAFSRLLGPSVLAAIDAEVVSLDNFGKPRLREPPDPPPPRS